MIVRLRVLLGLLIALSCWELSAQGPVQTIRGRVLDRATAEPLEGATVMLPDTDPLIGTSTDSSGVFILAQVTPGRYRIKVTYVGYQEQVVHDILLNAGKELVLDIRMSIAATALDEVTITSGVQVGDDPFQTDRLSSRNITVEETQRYPATFYDPARVVTTGPGVVVTNDQANHLVVRGNSPTGLLWRLEGVDVVNPNHLTNAGTFTDRPTLSGGGVAILSTQLMSDSRFFTGAFPSGYGNALSGVFDMYIRKGNDRKHEFTGQISLLGIDVSAEGPIAKNYKGSFLINYRYSTLGLFALAGIPIGDEVISFQDLAFNLALPAGKAGEFTLFGMGGKSTTTFEGSRDTSEWIVQKDRTNVDFFSDMGVIGLTHKIRLGQRSGLNSAVALSALNSGRIAETIEPGLAPLFLGRDELYTEKASFSSYYYRRLHARHLLKIGAQLNRDHVRAHTEEGVSGDTASTNAIVGALDHYLLQPYLVWQYTISSRVTLSTGLHSMHSALFNESLLEPRMRLKIDPDTASSVTLGYGLHGQIQHPSIYFGQNGTRDIGPTRAHHFVLGYSRWLTRYLRADVEIYHQALFQVPVSAMRESSFSALNLMEITPITEQLVNNGTGTNQGIDMSLEKSFGRGYYFLVAGSIYRSTYSGSDGIERNTRFNGNYLARATAGKEFSRTREGRNKVFGVNLMVTQAGGQRYTPVDAQASEAVGTTVILEDQAFSSQLDDLFRMDLRVFWRKNKTGYTRTLAIDVQNLTNSQNPAYQYYDTQQHEMVVSYQLGIIPFLSYRVEF